MDILKIEEISEWKIKAAKGRWNFRMLSRVTNMGSLESDEQIEYRGSIMKSPIISSGHYHRSFGGNSRKRGVGHTHPQVWNGKAKKWITLSFREYESLKTNLIEMKKRIKKEKI